MRLIILTLAVAATTASAGGKPALAHYLAQRPAGFVEQSVLSATPSPSPFPRGLTLTTSDGTVVTDATVWSNYALAEPAWARASDVSFALGSGANYAMVDWGGIAEYACQGSLIAEKLLALGTSAQRGLVAGWLYTLPLAASGQAWEAQNSQWHVATQGAWESSPEALMMLRLGVAHGAVPAYAFALAPDRLVCASRDGGKTYALASSVAQPGLDDSACTEAPELLLARSPLPATDAQQTPAFFVDTPSAPFSGPGGGLDNAGRLLTEALVLRSGGGDVTHLSLPLLPRARGAEMSWPAIVTVYDAETSAVVATSQLPPSGASTAAWYSFPCSVRSGARLVVVLAADNVAPAGVKQSDSWFLGASWLSNANPGTGGGASQGTYGSSPEWLRAEAGTALVPASVPTAAAAVSHELRRVQVAAAADAPLGVSLAQSAALLLSFVLALSSQVPTRAAGGYDVFVIPDAQFRGSLEDGVNSGCSYYDLLRIGFASSYINLRALQALEAYRELQAAALLPGSCANDAFGVDNAHSLDPTPTAPCYSSASTASAADSLRSAIGNRFSSAGGDYVDWFGCASMSITHGNVSACGLQDVTQGVLPSGTPLNVVATTFLPTLALAAKLRVPAGGTDVNATLNAFAAARDAARGGTMYGPGWFHNALRGVEGAVGGSRSLISQHDWRLVDQEGFAIHSANETGDWQLYNPEFVRATGINGYGQFEAQAENGGRFFSTTAFVWEGAGGPYTQLFADWSRLVASVDAVGAQIAANDTTTPLLPHDRAFLSSPTSSDASGIVNLLCTAVREQFHFPNITDRWGERLCAYYQDVAWALPENGVALVSAAKALFGVHVRADGTLAVNGGPPVHVTAATRPWNADGPLPAGWPTEIVRAQLVGLAVGTAPPVNVTCIAEPGKLACAMAVTASSRT